MGFCWWFRGYTYCFWIKTMNYANRWQWILNSIVFSFLKLTILSTAKPNYTWSFTESLLSKICNVVQCHLVQYGSQPLTTVTVLHQRYLDLHLNLTYLLPKNCIFSYTLWSLISDGVWQKWGWQPRQNY